MWGYFMEDYEESYKYKKEREDGLTEGEGLVMDSLVEAWNNFIKLNTTHTDELDDFRNSIHNCQKVLCMRILRRDYPEGYPTYSKQNDVFIGE